MALTTPSACSDRKAEWFGKAFFYKGITELDAHHPLPELYAKLAVGDRNVVCSHSGYGDGAFSILLTHDATGPSAIHVDFGIFGADEDDD